MKNLNKKEMGRISRKKGKRFEVLVRKNLETNGWFTVKWSNQVDLDKGLLVPAKSKFNPFLGRVMSEGTGWPDFLAYRRVKNNPEEKETIELIGVESKLRKYLDAEEKKKAKWLLEKRIFDKILIAYKKGRGNIEYEEFTEKE